MAKRTLDIIISATALMVFAPLILCLMWLVRIRLGRPVFYFQLRPGLNGELFRMYKFRTMTNETAPDGSLLPDGERLQPFGRFLRSTSLDELPGLWNVLKGNLSLVGPRPLLVEYLPLYSPDQARRHEVKPGLTGWAQVNGRNAISWDEKFELDVWYIDNRTIWLDVKILLLTVIKVFKREGINTPSDTIMPRFEGERGQMKR
jgi:lipopolysaccharide/colanic/teichoic acid biosynthesis glycosyltransferase